MCVCVVRGETVGMLFCCAVQRSLALNKHWCQTREKMTEIMHSENQGIDDCICMLAKEERDDFFGTG